MIYYFTGTGNSLSVAKKIGEKTGQQVISIREAEEENINSVAGDPIIGIVFPVYAWAPPKAVLDFVETLQTEEAYLFAVATCGDECGKGIRTLERALGRQVDAAFSVIMPNNYVVDFDVDSLEIQQEKLKQAREQMDYIGQIVLEQKSQVYSVDEGKLPLIKTKLIQPLFQRLYVSDKKFYAEDNCTSCGRCADVCPRGNIVVQKKPKWNGKCSLCLACVHHCPVRAVQCGRGTKKKGRYVNPDCRISYTGVRKQKEIE